MKIKVSPNLFIKISVTESFLALAEKLDLRQCFEHTDDEKWEIHTDKDGHDILVKYELPWYAYRIEHGEPWEIRESATTTDPVKVELYKHLDAIHKALDLHTVEHHVDWGYQ